MLSTTTGFDRDYSVDRYARYRGSTGIMFPVSGEDDRVHPKSVVFGFLLDSGPIAFAEELLLDHETYQREVDGKVLAVTMNDDGAVVLEDSAGALFEPIRLFWFAWYTFHPETGLVH